jgi:uncharacterized RmlC-like cupin family protein
MATSAADRVRVVQPGQTYEGRQGLTYGSDASAETVGAEHVCMNVLPMPDKARAKVHYHQGIETIAYLLEGECTVYFGDSLEHREIVRARDQIFVPADVPHAHAMRSVHHARGSWCTPPVAIRMASSYCQNLTSYSERNWAPSARADRFHVQI